MTLLRDFIENNIVKEAVKEVVEKSIEPKAIPEPIKNAVKAVETVRKVINLNDREVVEIVAKAVEENIGPTFRNAIPEPIKNTAKSVENVKKAINLNTRIVDFISSYTLETALRKLKKGDHIKVNRTVYSHHAIYIGDGKVIEYNDSVIKMSSLENFADGDYILKVNSKTKYSREQIVARAFSRLGEENYTVIWNNCENFAEWCRNGD